ncbi:MAG: heavy metal-binding domain-containing protein, partial [Dermabacter sp.]|nr:heavy metal-binding domain-containing protein [Dermabacter sp.]
EEELFEASQTAINEMCQRAQAMGANAVVGVHVDYFTAGSDNGMLAAIATGTAVEV